jgi:hypothetical protein
MHLATTLSNESYESQNSLLPQTPYRIDLSALHGSPTLEPKGSIEFSIFLHADIASQLEQSHQDLRLLFVYREVRQ